MSNNGDIPEQILVDNILSRLPVKSLCRFKSVSKPWRAYISDPTFIKTHLSQQNSHHKVILLSPSGCLFSVSLDDSSNNNGIATKLDFPIEFVDVLCSCNDLLLLVDKNQSLFFLNPSTRSYKKLHTPSSILSWGVYIYGLGYDSSLDDYKVLRIHHTYLDDDINGREIYLTQIEVYALKSGSWRNIKKNYPYDPSDCCPKNLVFLNGHGHWITNYDSGSYAIATFDLADENFWDLPPPSSLDNGKLIRYDLTVLGGCLCMFGRNMSMEISVWVMNEYGVVDSWTEFKIFNVSRITPICLLSDGEVLLQANYCKLVVYNTKEGKGSDMVVHDYSDKFKACVAYVESLVLPNWSDVTDEEDEQLPLRFNMDRWRIFQEIDVPNEGKSEEALANEGTNEAGSTSCSRIIEASSLATDPFSLSYGFDLLFNLEFEEGESYEDGLEDVLRSKP